MQHQADLDAYRRATRRAGWRTTTKPNPKVSFMHVNFDAALARLLAHEGGYTNHPDDPGGPTNFGITIHDYRKYLRADGAAGDVRMMRLDDAKAIYKAKYWDALRCDELPAGVDYAVFDYGVNSGIGRSAKVLQRVLGVPEDGIIGPVTIARAQRGNAQGVVAAVCEERLEFLRSLRTWPVFGKGWGRRVTEVKEAALEMATAS
jgi:lysozyme family protein